MTTKRSFNKKLKAYTLLELMVSMGIISIVIVIFFNALGLAMQASIKNLIRSSIREELTEISGEIIRSIRNAESVITCQNSSCTVIESGSQISWEICESSKICKYDRSRNLLFKSSDILRVDRLTFEQGFSDETNSFRASYLLTLVGSHINSETKISNIVRQTSVSTRNYEL